METLEMTKIESYEYELILIMRTTGKSLLEARQFEVGALDMAVDNIREKFESGELK